MIYNELFLKELMDSYEEYRKRLIALAERAIDMREGSEKEED